MKINQKFAKRAMVVASLTAGVVGLNSMFNEAQATGAGSNYLLEKCTINGSAGYKCSSSTSGNCASTSSCG